MQPEILSALDDLCLHFEPAYHAWQQALPPQEAAGPNKTAREILANDIRRLSYSVARADDTGQHAEFLTAAQMMLHLAPTQSYLPLDMETSRLRDDIKAHLPPAAPLAVPEALLLCRTHAPIHAKPLADAFARVFDFLQIGDGNLTSPEFSLSTEFRKLLGI
ncbi:MAG: hypothetical protein J0L97_02225 [Alphaproteobacteria bacterium]|nr:hypothetical protein [Alphaproteobacteria bacterium]